MIFLPTYSITETLSIINSCVNVAIARNESLAGSVVRIILAHSMNLNSDVGFNQMKSAPLSAEKIHFKLEEEAHQAFEKKIRSHSTRCRFKNASLYSMNIISSFVSLRIKSEFDEGPPPLVDIATLRKLLELMRLDAVPLLLRVRDTCCSRFISFKLYSFIPLSTFTFKKKFIQMVGSEKDQGGPEYMVNMEGIMIALKGKVRSFNESDFHANV